MANAVNCQCGGSRTQHLGDDDGCWGRCCIDLPPLARCQTFVEAVPAPRGRAESKPLASSRDTSEIASTVARLKAGTRRHEAFSLIQAAGARGLTDDELESNSGRSHQTMSATRNSLLADGVIVDSGQRRPTRYGNPAIAWVVAGYAYGTKSSTANS